MQQNWWESDPLASPRPNNVGMPAGPRPAPPQTPAQAATDQNQAAASALDPAMKAAQLEHTRLENEAARRKATEGILDPGALDRAARQYIMTGQMSSYGMGGAAQKVAIQNRADQIANVQGLTAEQQQVGYARYRNQAAALAQQEKALGGLRDNEAGALANLQQYVDQSAQLPLQTGSPLVNSMTQFAQRHIWSDPTLARMDSAMANAGGEMGKVISGTPQGGGVLSDSQRQEAIRMLQGAAPIETKRAILEQLRIDMDNRVKGYTNVINQGYAGLQGGGQQSAIAGAMPGAPGAGGDQPPVIGGGGPQGGPPAGGPPGSSGAPPGGRGGGNPQTWRDMPNGGPEQGIAQGPMHDVFDSAISARGEQMIRAGASAADINKMLGPGRYHPVTQAEISAVQTYLRNHPNYGGFFQAVRTEPLTGAARVNHDFANSKYGAAVGEYLNAATGNHLDNIANMAGGDGKLVNLGLEASRQNHPYASMAGDLAAGASVYGAGRAVAGKLAGTAAARIAAKLPGWTAPVLGDAGIGAYEGSGANGEQVFDPASAGMGAAVAAGTGAAVRGGLGVGARAVSPTGGDMNLLYQQGVKPSLGQRMGGGYGRFEQANASLPFVGGFIRGNRNAAIDQAQRGAFNTALNDIGETLPPGTVKGTQAHAYMQQAFDKAYDGARSGMRFVPDQQYMQDLQGFMQTLGDGTLNEQQAAQVATRVKTAVQSRLKAQKGSLSGDAYAQATNDLSRTARQWAANPATSAQADALRGYIGIMDDAARRASNPEAVAALDAADRGYSKAVVIESASKMNTGGEFTGRQLDIAAKNTSPSVRKRSYLRGDAPMQDYASQMARLGDTVGNSGTLDRILATGGAGLAIAHPMGMMPSLSSVLTNAPILREGVNLALSPNRASLAPVRNYINGRKAYAGGLFGAAAAQRAVGQ